MKLGSRIFATSTESLVIASRRAVVMEVISYLWIDNIDDVRRCGVMHGIRSD
jgi:hypothetical protein